MYISISKHNVWHSRCSVNPNCINQWISWSKVLSSLGSCDQTQRSWFSRKWSDWGMLNWDERKKSKCNCSVNTGGGSEKEPMGQVRAKDIYTESDPHGDNRWRVRLYELVKTWNKKINRIQPMGAQYKPKEELVGKTEETISNVGRKHWVLSEETKKKKDQNSQKMVWWGTNAVKLSE